MKSIKILKAGEAEVDRFVPYSFIQNEEFLSSMRLLKQLRRQSSREEIQKLAKKHKIPFDKEKALFAKKIINMMLDEISDGK